MLNLACDRGSSRQKLLEIVGIAPALIAKDTPVSALLYGQLHHQIIREYRDEWFGMLSGGSVPEGAIRFLCQSVVHCRTLYDAVIHTQAFFELCRGFKVKMVFEQEGGETCFRLAPLSDVPDNEFDQLLAKTSANTIKSTLMVWHGFSCWLIGQEIPLKRVDYHFEANDNGKQGKHDPAYPIYYSQLSSGFRIDSQFMQSPIIQQEEGIPEFLRRAPYYVFIKSSKTDETFAQRVKAILAKNMGDEFPNAPAVAEFLNVSVTTLHRKLSQEKTSFQQIKDESRMEAAIHYLNCPDLSTSKIAELVGFENPSTFFRSFKKWTGLPPGEYRKQLLPAQ